MSENARKFEEYLKKKGFKGFVFYKSQTGTMMEGPCMLKNKKKVIFRMYFSKKEDVVGLFINDIAYAEECKKREQILEKLNELNGNYTFLKYLINDDGIRLESYRQIFDDFSSERTMKLFLTMIDVVETDYYDIRNVL